MDVAVVGGAGFIGGYLVDELVAGGHAVTVYDPRPPRQQDVRWLDGAGGSPTGPHDAVFMLAAMADVIEVNRDPIESIRRNVVLAGDVYRRCVEQGVQHMLFASTIWVYDSVRDHREDGVADVIDAVNPYSAGKLCAEIMLRSLTRHYADATTLTVMRYGIPYGPGMRQHAVIPTFVARMLAGEELVVNGSLDVGRPFLHVRDLAQGNARLLAADPGTYNVSGESLITLRHIIDELRVVFDRKPRVVVNNQRSIDTAAQLPSIDRMLGLGWRPQISLREGLIEMVADQSARSRVSEPARSS